MPAVETVNLTSCGPGISLVAGTGSNGDSRNPVLTVRSLLAGRGIVIKQGESLADVTISATGLPELTSLITGHVHWVAGGVSPNNLPIFTAAYPLIVTAIVGRVEVSSSSAASLMLMKVSSGVAIASGWPLAQTPFNAAGSPHVNQALPLVDDITVLRLGVGDTIGVKTTGTWTGACGGITVHLAPA